MVPAAIDRLDLVLFHCQLEKLYRDLAHANNTHVPANGRRIGRKIANRAVEEEGSSRGFTVTSTSSNQCRITNRSTRSDAPVEEAIKLPPMVRRTVGANVEAN